MNVARIAAAALALAAVAAIGLGARCSLAGMARCSVAALTGHAPKLDVPYAATRPELVERMLDLGAVGAGTRLLDLGTGDGRIALAAARRGALAEGIDIDPVLVNEASEAAAAQGLSARARFRTADLFATPLKGRDAVTMFLLPQVNMRLRPRLLAELAPGARVVSHAFTMGDWTPDAEARVGGAHAYLWVVPADAGGRWKLSDGGELMLVQRFQMLTGTLARPGAEAVPVVGRLAGPVMRIVANAREYRGRVAGDRLSGVDWSATRTRR